MFRRIPFSSLVPAAGLIVSSVALRFQMKVLYPWHEDLSRQIEGLERNIKLLQEEVKKNNNKDNKKQK
uniref:Uncharacterized protein n=1 Tax=viral metagenome TaxID=1070528 RepID=A0A6C0D3G5_9ZZZZ